MDRVPPIHVLISADIMLCIGIGSAWIIHIVINLSWMCQDLLTWRWVMAKEKSGVWQYFSVCATDASSSKVSCSSCTETVCIYISTFSYQLKFTNLESIYNIHAAIINCLLVSVWVSAMFTHSRISIGNIS